MEVLSQKKTSAHPQAQTTPTNIVACMQQPWLPPASTQQQ